MGNTSFIYLVILSKTQRQSSIKFKSSRTVIINDKVYLATHSLKQLNILSQHTKKWNCLVY